MRTSRHAMMSILTAAFLVSTHCYAATLGDRAPELQIREWVKGDALSLEDGKGEKLFVIEFWESWCGPCRSIIPHLTELQKRFNNDVIFIGITTEQDADKIGAFVDAQKDTMGYRVAMDDEQKTYKAYMHAFNISQIPYAFLVDREGRLVWHAHPMNDFDTVIAKAVAGELDVANVVDAHRISEEKFVKRRMHYQQAYKDFELVQSLALDAEGDVAELRSHLEAISTSFADLPDFLNACAWWLLTDANVHHRALDLALKLSARAVEGYERKDPASLDTYARALFDNGRREEAIAQERLALQVLRSDEYLSNSHHGKEMIKEMESALERYLAAPQSTP